MATGVGPGMVTGLVSRRAALRLAAGSSLVAVAGCGVDASSGRRTATAGSTTTSVDSDIALVRQAIDGEERLAGFCTEAASEFPSERVLLLRLAGLQRMHVSRLRATLTNLDPPLTRAHPPVPRTAGRMRTVLGDLALQARGDRSAACLAATSGLLAELFGSVAAAHGVTVLALDPSEATPSIPVPTSVPTAEPLQPCLAAEHAAVFGYGVLGGVVSAGVSDAPIAKTAVASYDAHRSRRDLLLELIAATSATPVAAQAAYDVPFRVTGEATARRLAQVIEARCATVYARATAASTGAARALTSGTLLDCAVRAARWGAAPTAFPGLDPA
jgi:uncharacterized protein DUF4439